MRGGRLPGAMPPTDDEIREMAKARVGFRSHAVAYVLVNLFLAALWFMQTKGNGAYWPLWAHLGWGLGLAFHGWQAYGPHVDAVSREEAKLRERLGRT